MGINSFWGLKDSALYLTIEGYSNLTVILALLSSIVWELTLNIIMIVFLAKNQKFQNEKGVTPRKGLMNCFYSSAPRYQLIFRAVGLLSAIACCDILSLFLYAIAGYLDTRTGLSLNMITVSLTLPHIHCTFNLTDYLLKTIKSLEVEAQDVIALHDIKTIERHERMIRKGSFNSSNTWLSGTDIVEEGLLTGTQLPPTDISFSRLTHSMFNDENRSSSAGGVVSRQ